MRHRSPRNLLLAMALLALPLPAAAVVTTFDITAPSEAVPEATLEIFLADEPEQVVEERKIESEGTVTVELEPGRSYGVRIKDGPVLVERFEGGDDLRLAIPMAFARAALGWTVSFGTGGGYSSYGAKGEMESTPILSASSSDDVSGGAWMGDLQVMAPPCEIIPGSPRAFLQFGGMLHSDSQTLVSDGVDGVIEAKLEAKTTGTWSVGVGAQFVFDLAGHEVRVKPGVSYGQHLMKLRAKLLETGLGDEMSRSSRNHTLHFIRPELSLEAPVGTTGPVEISAYVSGGAAIRVSGSSTSLRVDGMGGSVDYRFKPDSVGYNVGAGVRFSWNPLALH